MNKISKAIRLWTLDIALRGKDKKMKKKYDYKHIHLLECTYNNLEVTHCVEH